MLPATYTDGLTRWDKLERPTRRELDVLRLLAEGRTFAQVAAELYLSRNTVKIHVQHLRTRFNAHTAAQAVAEGFRRGYLV